MIKHIKGIGEVEVFDKSETIKNPFSGESCELEPEAVAIYDLIKGAEILEKYETVERGLDYFRKHWSKEYMILLD